MILYLKGLQNVRGSKLEFLFLPGVTPNLLSKIVQTHKKIQTFNFGLSPLYSPDTRMYSISFESSNKGAINFCFVKRQAALYIMLGQNYPSMYIALCTGR